LFKTDSEKYKQVKREAIFTAISLAALIIFWLIAGFGTSSIEIKIFHLPLWAILGTIGVWIAAIILTFLLTKLIFRDMELGGQKND